MYVPAAGLGYYTASYFDKKRYFALWDQFNRRWIGPTVMNEWDANQKIDWFRASHPDYYAVGTPHLLENPYVVYYDGKKWVRFCQFPDGSCSSSIV
jgi:hypothetical protein